MIELRHDQLVFSFSEVHEDARFSVEFQRTLRIPDDDATYPLPPGLGRFPVRHVDDVDERAPETWRTRGGVMLPMYQSEALWLSFSSPTSFPFALKIAAGKVNAVNGDPPTVPPTATEYSSAGLPWFDYYDEDQFPLPAGDGLGGLKSVAQLGAENRDNPLPENESVEVSDEVVVKLGRDEEAGVREGEW